MIYIKRFNLCFVRIPKNASSSVMEFLYYNFVDPKEDKVSYIMDWKTGESVVQELNTPHIPHFHVDAQYLIDNEIVPENAKFFAVMRNPFEKHLSFYTFKCRQAKEMYGMHYTPDRKEFKTYFTNGMMNGEDRIIDVLSEASGVDKSLISYKVERLRYKQGNQIYTYPNYEFTINKRNHGLNRTLNFCPSHFAQRQVDFLKYNGKNIGTFWLYENIKQHLEDLCREYEIVPNFELPHTNRSSNFTSSTVDAFYDLHFRKEVLNAYKEDFEMYDELKRNYNVKEA